MKTVAMRTAVRVLVAGAVIAGCGGVSAGAPLARSDATRLRRELAAIRVAAAARDPGKAHRAVAALRSDLHRLVRAGRLSAVEGRSMLAVLARADSRIAAEVRPPPPSGSSETRGASSTRPAISSTTPAMSSTTPSASKRSPAGPPAGHGHGKDRGQGHGKNRGHGHPKNGHGKGHGHSHGKGHGHGHDDGDESGGN